MSVIPSAMNAMHANMEITDTFYSVLRDEEVKNRISNLNKKGRSSDKGEVIEILEDLLSNLKKRHLKTNDQIRESGQK